MKNKILNMKINNCISPPANFSNDKITFSVHIYFIVH